MPLAAEASIESQAFALTTAQQRLALVPENINIFSAGTRGSGKTRGALYDAVRHCSKYGSKARVWVLRKSLVGLRDTEAELRGIVPVLFPGARYNAQRHQWAIPNGATIELRCLESERDFPSLQGRNCTLLIVDEGQQWVDPLPLDLARSCLRGPAEVPVRSIFCANPAGRGGDWLFRRFFAHGAPDGVPFECPDTGTKWVRLFSSYKDNHFIDRDRYERELRGIPDADLVRAWLEGDFSVLRGSYFGSVLSEQNQIDDWLPSWREPTTVPDRDPVALHTGFRLSLAFDFGVSAPAACLVLARSSGAVGPDARWYPRGSWVALDEWTTAKIDEGRLNEGTPLTIGQQAEAIKRLAARWRIPPSGVADPAIFARTGSDLGTVADQFAQHGVRWRPAPRKERVAGWARVSELLSNAGQLDQPALYACRRCRYLWTTLVHAPRDPRRPDDLDTSYADHGLDALRYRLIDDSDVSIGVQEIRF